jgi:Flp pilus assembly pilin Flp
MFRPTTFSLDLPSGCDRGQTTAEYGLVILAAGTLALALILWARSSGSITGLFQQVIDQLTGAL